MASNQFSNSNGLEDAARSYMADIVEDHSGLFRELAIRVWPLNAGSEESTIFDARTTIEPYLGEDAEKGEYEATIKLKKWSKTNAKN